MAARVQAAAAVVVLSWHGPEPTAEYLRENCTKDPRFSKDEQDALHKKLAPPQFRLDAKVPLEGEHRYAVLPAIRELHTTNKHLHKMN